MRNDDKDKFYTSDYLLGKVDPYDLQFPYVRTDLSNLMTSYQSKPKPKEELKAKPIQKPQRPLPKPMTNKAPTNLCAIRAAGELSRADVGIDGSRRYLKEKVVATYEAVWRGDDLSSSGGIGALFDLKANAVWLQAKVATASSAELSAHKPVVRQLFAECCARLEATAA